MIVGSSSVEIGQDAGAPSRLSYDEVGT